MLPVTDSNPNAEFSAHDDSYSQHSDVDMDDVDMGSATSDDHHHQVSDDTQPENALEATEPSDQPDTFNPFQSNTKPGDDSVYKAYVAEGETRLTDMDQEAEGYFSDQDSEDYYDGIESEEVAAKTEDAQEEPEVASDPEPEPSHPFSDDEDDDFDPDVGEKTRVGGPLDYD